MQSGTAPFLSEFTFKNLEFTTTQSVDNRYQYIGDIGEDWTLQPKPPSFSTDKPLVWACCLILTQFEPFLKQSLIFYSLICHCHVSECLRMVIQANECMLFRGPCLKMQSSLPVLTLFLKNLFVVLLHSFAIYLSYFPNKAASTNILLPLPYFLELSPSHSLFNIK